jgi:DNA-binding transcriptional MerR regulator/quercetin dioxygenase-like cupin family protein
MAYTVRQVAKLSKVSVRTLHFYHETGLLKPAYLRANGYRCYEEPQLLTLQQILFYRELGLELRQIKQILGRADFEKVAALASHREVLEQKLQRTRTLLGTIDKTIDHLKGAKKMKNEEMFAGFSIAPGDDRFGHKVRLIDEPHDCKVSGEDTSGAVAVFEYTGRSGGPRHLHNNQDEWIYIIDGEFDFWVGKRRFRAKPGECVFIPRNLPHAWATVNEQPGKIIDMYQPAGRIEEFFQELGKYRNPPIHEALGIDGLKTFFRSFDMDMVGPPMHWTETSA